jgi:DNA-binding response OmpR family regulator
MNVPSTDSPSRRSTRAEPERRPRVLVVDDEPKFVQGIAFYLDLNGYEVVSATDGPSALEQAAAHPPDLVLLDIMMSGLDGNEVCERIRQTSMVPIIMLTARGENEDKVRSLDVGADDYVTKPFSADELLARVRAALRRAKYTPPAVVEQSLVRGNLRIDLATQRVLVRGSLVELPKVEFRLLCELAGSPGRVFSPSELLERVWRPDEDNSVQLVWQAIHRLRVKIELDQARPRYILTKHGTGYYFASSESV